MQPTATPDQDSPNTLIPLGEDQQSHILPQEEMLGKGAPDILGSDRKTPSGASGSLVVEEGPPDRFYQTSPSLYNPLTPVSLTKRNHITPVNLTELYPLTPLSLTELHSLTPVSLFL